MIVREVSPRESSNRSCQFFRENGSLGNSGLGDNHPITHGNLLEGCHTLGVKTVRSMVCRPKDGSSSQL